MTLRRFDSAWSMISCEDGNLDTGRAGTGGTTDNLLPPLVEVVTVAVVEDDHLLWFRTPVAETGTGVDGSLLTVVADHLLGGTSRRLTIGAVGTALRGGAFKPGGRLGFSGRELF